jgi:transcriptional regulator with PAS, ATPase and Fis domain
MSYLKAVMAEVEKALIISTSRHCNTRTELAKELGISYRDLLIKIKKHELGALFDQVRLTR